jgi:hypothetical protein
LAQVESIRACGSSIFKPDKGRVQCRRGVNFATRQEPTDVVALAYAAQWVECEKTMKSAHPEAGEPLGSSIDDAIAHYKERVTRLVIDAYAERFGPMFADNLAAVMFEVFKAGMILGLGHSSKHSSTVEILKHAPPQGSG